MSKDDYTHVFHTFGPLYAEDSEILILGSFPSVKSREQNFYYGHPQNRFWKVMAAVLECPVPDTIEEKKRMMITNHIAVWDVIEECDIIGSSDSSIRNAVPTNIGSLLQKTKIDKILVNGRLAGKLYHKYTEKLTGIEGIVLPSTSPANAACSLDRLIYYYKIALTKNR